MKASAYVGRVGGLAVALGIGVALSWGNGVAAADTGHAAPHSSPSDASSSGSSSETKASVVKQSTTTAISAQSVTSHNPVTTITKAVSGFVKAVETTVTDHAPTLPADSPLSWLVAAAARRETEGPTDVLHQMIYVPIHTGVEKWIASDAGQRVDAVINTLAGSYVIGDGAVGTEAHPNGGAGGWLAGDGGAGWDSTVVGMAGGSGGAGGLLGDGGSGGAGGAGAAGGAGGNGGRLMGDGGSGGKGGDGDAEVDGGAGGAGGTALGLVGIAGGGGGGGDGAVGGAGGDGGNGRGWYVNGGDGGDAGAGSDPTALAALGGAGGTGGLLGLLGSHGLGGHYGTVAGSTTSTATTTSVSTTGTWMTNGTGQVLILHGVNVSYKEAPYEVSAAGFSQDDAAFLAANGFNVVRLSVIWAAAEPEPGVYDTAYLNSVNQTVQTLAAQGIYTIVDFHQDLYGSTFGGEGAPAWATQTGGFPNPQLGFPLTAFLSPAENNAWNAFWSNYKASNSIGLENNYALMAQHVAAYFAGDPNVAGYEIMNEPYPGSLLDVVSILGNPAFGKQNLTQFYDQVGSAIRSVDSTTPVFYEPYAATSFGVPIQLGAVDVPNSVLSFHDYCAVQSASKCLPDVEGVAKAAVAWAEAHGIPVFMTEFGASSTQGVITASMDPADQFLMGWTEWAYSSVGDTTTSASPASLESLVYDPSLPPTGDNVNTANLATLAQPYPQLISGTPNAWSFENGIFQFSYSTEKVDGSGNFAAGSQTTISTPAVEFPNGYQVTVTGGHVVSAPNAAQLVIASDDGATTVGVVVTASAEETSAPAV
ncbi:cellulase family glycosylhydrolase [Mycolicibacterium sphagni]|uniref:cellulase family glycosylhydrolase n=1 Tax=Mycolicibacterium sphagni TaxID=1786 RepID=UPI0021F387E1|nr:cellulase family glycosylhydrolase [Mycolicibacterium sphagni]MCV7177375.1 cellulase family glycosylhydrolase [Mycolicibacterium sphagni]